MIGQHLQIFQRALDSLPLGVTITDPEGTILYVNQADADMHGYDVDELIGKNARIFSTSRHWRVLTMEDFQSIHVWRRETINRKKDRTLFPVMLTSDVVTTPEGEILGMITYCEDITQKKATEEQHKQKELAFRKLQHDTLHDPLTGLMNRVLFHDRMTVAFNRCRRRKNGTIAVMFIDLDNFKQINDTQGHRMGDLVLCEISERLKHCLRPTDSVARLGGDEFGVLLDDLNRQEDAIPVVHRIQSEIQRSFDIDGSPQQMSASIGVAFPSRDIINVEELLNRSDLAMYNAKNSGKNRYMLHPPAIFLCLQPLHTTTLPGHVRTRFVPNDFFFVS